MKKRDYGEVPSLECRHESHEKVNKQKRCSQILGILGDRELTAKEIAYEMNLIGWIPDADRNHTSPRLNEMCKDGRVEQVGKKKCQWTGKTVTVYRRLKR